ncbi:transmembrane protein, putative [Medicago truncatula]|uniref:Transmembrane protein, putative n=1 Tax=Medicago truncatula TaxID=3880 RepID=G7L4F8_MEDTR|nr:transmembrane protein, putative [Medicago truncatula]
MEYQKYHKLAIWTIELYGSTILPDLFVLIGGRNRKMVRTAWIAAQRRGRGDNVDPAELGWKPRKKVCGSFCHPVSVSFSKIPGLPGRVRDPVRSYDPYYDPPIHDLKGSTRSYLGSRVCLPWSYCLSQEYKYSMKCMLLVA